MTATTLKRPVSKSPSAKPAPVVESALDIDEEYEDIHLLMDGLPAVGTIDTGNVCGRLTYLAIQIFGQKAPGEKGHHVDVFDAEALLIGAKCAGDASPGQLAIIDIALARLSTYLERLDHNFIEESAGKFDTAPGGDDPSLRTDNPLNCNAGDALAFQACCEIESLSLLLIEQTKSSDLAHIVRALAGRIHAASGVLCAFVAEEPQMSLAEADYEINRSAFARPG
jgi:hypothetical protein